jgi:hypothetical protein
MADKDDVHIGENSPEKVALVLLGAIAAAEKKFLWKISPSGSAPEKKWILDTYKECLMAVKYPSE